MFLFGENGNIDAGFLQQPWDWFAMLLTTSCFQHKAQGPQSPVQSSRERFRTCVAAYRQQLIGFPECFLPPPPRSDTGRRKDFIGFDSPPRRGLWCVSSASSFAPLA